jgi:hypothetical protein
MSHPIQTSLFSLSNKMQLIDQLDADWNTFSWLLKRSISGFSEDSSLNEMAKELHAFLFVIKSLGMDFLDSKNVSSNTMDDFRVCVEKCIDGFVDGVKGNRINFSLKTRFSFDLYIRILYELIIPGESQRKGRPISFSNRVDQLVKKMKSSPMYRRSYDRKLFVRSLDDFREETKQQYWQLSGLVHGNNLGEEPNTISDFLEGILLREPVSPTYPICLSRAQEVYSLLLNFLLLTISMPESTTISRYKIDIYIGYLRNQYTFHCIL